MQIDLRLRNYSINTEKMYLRHADMFVRHFNRSPVRLGPDHIRTYLMYVIETRACSWSWWRQAVSALRFLYGTTLGRRDVVPRIPFPRREVRLPAHIQDRSVAVPGPGPATARTLRHSFATHHLEAGTDILTIQRPLGHAHLQSTLVYLHVSRRHISSVPSPLERLGVDVAPTQLTLQGF